MQTNRKMCLKIGFILLATVLGTTLAQEQRKYRSNRIICEIPLGRGFLSYINRGADFPAGP